MLVIRFSRVGKKNQPAFKIVVTEKGRPPKSGKFVEQVGFYNPLTKEKVLNQERVKYWIGVGAQPSPTVFNLLLEEKIIEGKKIPVHKKGKKKTSPAEASVEEKATDVKEEKTEEKPKEKTRKEAPKEEELPEKLKEEKKEVTEEAKEPKVSEQTKEA